MLHRKSWTLLPEAGPSNLEIIRNDTQDWQINKASLGALRILADFDLSVGVGEMDRAIDSAMHSGTLLELASTAAGIGEISKDEMAKYTIATKALDRLNELRKGRDIKKPYQKATLRIISPRVQLNTNIGNEGHGYLFRRQRLAEPGEEFHGRIYNFYTHPEYGGRLELEHRFGLLVVQGLVDTVRFTPNVELEISMRTRHLAEK